MRMSGRSACLAHKHKAHGFGPWTFRRGGVAPIIMVLKREASTEATPIYYTRPILSE